MREWVRMLRLNESGDGVEVELDELTSTTMSQQGENQAEIPEKDVQCDAASSSVNARTLVLCVCVYVR